MISREYFSADGKQGAPSGRNKAVQKIKEKIEPRRREEREEFFFMNICT
jgi:hypothetical protein